MKFFLNDILVSPLDGLNIGLSSDFKDRSSIEELELSTLSLILPREGVDIVKQWEID